MEAHQYRVEEMTKLNFQPTVIITSCNHREYLREALESVVSQTLKPHEIFVADDAFTDGSQDLIHVYELGYPALVKGVLQSVNVGIPRNRNAALRSVKGNYVGILDGDDRFRANKLELQYNKLCQRPNCQGVFGNFELFDENIETFTRFKWEGPQPEG